MGPGGMMGQYYSDFHAGLNDALAYAMLAAIAAALTIGFIISRSVVSPLRKIMDATQRIADGHYDERVQVGGDDELSQLASRFNRMAEKLEQVETMRKRLIGDVSHELRTPLTAIKGSMEGLMDGILPANAETYSDIHQEADRLDRLVNDLQELSRVESGASPLEIRPVETSTLTQTVFKRLSPQYVSKEIALSLDLEPGLPQVMADEDRAVQILTNLLGNALQYTPSNGKVELSVHSHGSEVWFAVQDSGIGLSVEDQQRIFDRFYRVDKSRSRRTGGGSGVGLTIARALVEAMNGRIWVESPGEGKGSTFTFSLPKAK